MGEPLRGGVRSADKPRKKDFENRHISKLERKYVMLLDFTCW